MYATQACSCLFQIGSSFRGATCTHWGVLHLGGASNFEKAGQLTVLCVLSQLEALAVEKYESMHGVKAERQKRFQKRAERAEQRQEAAGTFSLLISMRMRGMHLYLPLPTASFCALRSISWLHAVCMLPDMAL